MLRILLGFAALALSVTAAADGDPVRGETLNVTCVACHGQDGNSPAGAFPSIAGQGERYLTEQLYAIKSGDRAAMLMTGILDNFSDQDMQDVAAYYASQTPTIGATDPDLLELGETIYRAGIARKNVAACIACHSPSGQGNAAAAFPMLSGQWPEYTETQLKAYRSGARKHDMMTSIAMDLSDDEIKAVSSYVYGLSK